MGEILLAIGAVIILVVSIGNSAESNHEKKVIIECSKSGYVVFEKQDVKILCSVEKK